MRSSPIVRLIASALAGAAAALLLLALLEQANGGVGFAQTGAATALGWVWPLLACGAGFALGWVLLRPHAREGADDASGLPRCPRCDGPVQSRWRVCPHCGSIIKGTEDADSDR